MYGEPVRFVRGTLSSGLSTSQPAESTNRDNSSDSGTSLSGGAIAGIVIGALVFGAVLATAVFMLLRRNRLRKLAAESTSGPSAPSDSGKAELPGDTGGSDENTQHRRPQELDSSPVGALPMAQPVELGTNSIQTNAMKTA